MGALRNRFAFSLWIFPVLSVMLLVFILSVRLQSDPDLGSHLKAGKWISENHTVPQKEIFCYGAQGNDYIDMNWLFQVIVYQVYNFAGYQGLSLSVSILALLLFFLLLLKFRKTGTPGAVTCLVLLAGFLVIEQRFTLRPELLTFLFITGYLLILDRYYHAGKDLLFLLPVIMLFWVNIHGLFILGLVLAGTYWISLVVRDRSFHLKFFAWLIVTALTCMVNPYFIRGITFPFELLTRFDAQNVFHQHIKELGSFFSLDSFVFKDLLFLAFAGTTILATILTIRKRKLHELILLALFLYLALVAVRNLGLFVVVTIPVLSASLRDLSEMIRNDRESSGTGSGKRIIGGTAFVLLILIPLLMIPRIWTNSYYLSNNSYSRTGTGIDPNHQPVRASEFLVSNHLDGRVLNSIAFGGWLSWSLPQQVFIDGRLEVMTEPIYQEVVDSWDKGLGKLIGKYQPDLIVYNYVKYFPWTLWLSGDPGWRLIYLDGFAAIYARRDYAPEITPLELGSLPAAYGLSPELPGDQELKILRQVPGSMLNAWAEGFYRVRDENIANFQNIASFSLQQKNTGVAERFFAESLRLSKNRNTPVYYALADIYRELGENEKAEICYNRILSEDPGNETAFNALRTLKEPDSSMSVTSSASENEARNYFNSGNQKYRYGDVEGALGDYTKAISLKPDYYKAYNNRGIAKALGQKKYKEALEDFDRAIDIKPDYADAWLGRGTAKFNLKDPAGACSDWNKALSLGNRSAEDMIIQYCKK